MILIPKRETKTIVQTNQSKILGDFWASFNIDLQSNLGVIKVSPRMKLAENSSLSNFGMPVAFRHFDNRIYTIAGTRIFHTGTSGSPEKTNYSEDTSTGYKTTYDARWSDMELFNGQLFTTTNDELMSKAPAPTNADGDWTERDSAFSDETTPHFLCYFKKFNRLYYNDGELIQSIDNTYSVATSGDYTLDMQFEDTETISCMRATSNAIFIGTIRQSNIQANIKGAVYEWDGLSSQVTARYELDNQGALAMVVKGEIPYIIDARGALRKFTGYSFQDIGRLPRGNVLPYNLSTNDNDKWIHPNGLTVTEDDTFMVLVNNLLGDNAGSILENMPSGIWEFTEENGFVHRYSLSYTTDTTITDYGQNRLSAVGALSNMNKYTTSSTRNGQYVCGATYYSDASSTLTGLFYDDSSDIIQKNGYFVSSWFLASNLKDNWQKFGIRFREFLDSADQIVLKYRTREADPIYIDITWNDTTSFHTTTDVDDYVGYEVEILQGVGSGKCFHISSISGFSPWKVNLDETLTGATGTAKARLQNWTKAKAITSQNVESSLYTIGAAGERIQVKCCMQFTGDDELYELAVINSVNTKLE